MQHPHIAYTELPDPLSAFYDEEMRGFKYDWWQITKHLMLVALAASCSWLIVIAIAVALFAALAHGATVCQTPVLAPDGVTLPLDDPCLGAPVFVLPGADALIGLNDNLGGGDRDYNDAMIAARFAALAAGLASVEVQWLGQASAHDVWAEVAGVLVAKEPGWQHIGAAAIGSELAVFVRDFTEGERFSYRDPENGWARQEVPEPAAWSLAVIGLGLVVVRRWWL